MCQSGGSLAPYIQLRTTKAGMPKRPIIEKKGAVSEIKCKTIKFYRGRGSITVQDRGVGEASRTIMKFMLAGLL